MRSCAGRGLLWIGWIWVVSNSVQAYDAYDYIYEYFGNDTLYLDPYVELRVVGSHEPKTWSAPASDSDAHAGNQQTSGRHQTWTVTATRIDKKSSSEPALVSDSSSSDPSSYTGSSTSAEHSPASGQSEPQSRGSEGSDLEIAGTCSYGSCSNLEASETEAGHSNQAEAVQQGGSGGDPAQQGTSQAARAFLADGSSSQAVGDGSIGSDAVHNQPGSQYNQRHSQQSTQHGSTAAGASTRIPSSGQQPQSQQQDVTMRDLLDDGSYSPDRAHPLWMWDTCTLDGEAVVLNGTRHCHLSMVGSDTFADLLPGGLDGIYRLTGCYAGKAYYLREEVPGSSEVRSLWWHPYLGSWIYAFDQVPRDDNIIMYGTVGKISPLDVDGWHLAAVYNGVESQHLKSDDEDLYFKIPVGFVSVVCLDDLLPRAYQSVDPEQKDEVDEYEDAQEEEEESPTRPVHTSTQDAQHTQEQHVGSGAAGTSQKSKHKVSIKAVTSQKQAAASSSNEGAARHDDNGRRGKTTRQQPGEKRDEL